MAGHTGSKLDWPAVLFNETDYSGNRKIEGEYIYIYKYTLLFIKQLWESFVTKDRISVPAHV